VAVAAPSLAATAGPSFVSLLAGTLFSMCGDRRGPSLLSLVGFLPDVGGRQDVGGRRSGRR